MGITQVLKAQGAKMMKSIMGDGSMEQANTASNERGLTEDR